MAEKIQPDNLQDFAVDEGVLEKFPVGTKVLLSRRLDTSAWTQTAQIRVKLPDDTESNYFLKSASNDHGRVMMQGEFGAMSELYNWTPEFVPKPHSWGKYKEQEIYFFLAECVELESGMPDPEQLCKNLAHLHRISRSPDGNFGFPVTTCQGRVPQDVRWQASWTVFFTQLIRHVMQLDFELNGYWEALDILQKRLVSHVVPHLLGALESDGNRVQPSLLHSDLWEGNTGTEAGTGRVVIFDGASFYGHNEMDVANWRCYYNKIAKKVYTETYLCHFEPSEPKQQWEDRNRLYSIYYNIIYSVNHLDAGKAVRQLAYSDMYTLVDKFAPFERQGPPKLDKSTMASLSSERDHTLVS